MGIQQLQRKYLLNNIIKGYYSKGIVPTYDNIREAMIKILNDFAPGQPFFKAHPQPYKRHAIIDGDRGHNQNIEDLSADLSLLYDATREAVNEINNLHKKYSIKRRSILKSLKELESQVEELLLLSEDTEGFINSVYDDFTSNSKVDTAASTPNIVNTEDGIVSLPRILRSSSRIDLRNLYYKERPDFLDFTSRTQPAVIKSSAMPLSLFGNVFKDDGSIWELHILTQKPGKVVVEFNVPFDTIQDFNGVKLIAHQPNTALIDIFYLSNKSDSNYTRFPAALNPFELKNNISIFGSSVTTRDIRIRMQKDVPDGIDVINGEAYPEYIFGLKKIEAYNNSTFVNRGILVSKELTFQGLAEDSIIEKISLSVKEDIPEDTNINYYIRKPGFDWQPIIPINREDITNQQGILDFNIVKKSDIIFRNFTDFKPTQLNNQLINGKYSYFIPAIINNIPMSYTIDRTIVKETAELWRGKNAWQLYNQGEKLVNEREIEAVWENDRIEFNEEDYEIVYNSVTNMRYSFIDALDGEEKKFKEAVDGDYIVQYADNSGVIIRNKAGNIPADASMKFSFRYKQHISHNRYVTWININSDRSIKCLATPISGTISDIFRVSYGPNDDDWVDFKMRIDGELVVPKNKLINLNAGWHEIVIESIGTVQINKSDFTEKVLDGRNAAFPTIKTDRANSETDKMFAWRYPMEQVSLFTLQNKVLKDDHNKYAIVERDGTTLFVLNYWPGWEVNGINTKSEEFVLSYSYIPAIIDNKIQFKAELSSNKLNITPQLMKYSIRGGLKQ